MSVFSAAFLHNNLMVLFGISAVSDNGATDNTEGQ
jgi:hypothetical protein